MDPLLKHVSGPHGNYTVDLRVQLGRGSFGAVYMGYVANTDITVAAKQLHYKGELIVLSESDSKNPNPLI